MSANLNPIHRHFPRDDLARRRKSALRMAWLIGAGVLLLYIGGLFVSRG
jgi:hypothetical protein